MIKSKVIITVTVLMILMSGLVYANPEIKTSVSSINFGHIGIDYNLYYTIELQNTGNSELIIQGAYPSCDCSRVFKSDTAVAPGESTTIRLRFNTKNWYGDTEQHITIESNDPKLPSVQIPYESHVGQYLRGIIPSPKALFLLPGKSQGEIAIVNSNYDELELEILDQADSFYRLTIIENKAEKGEKLVIKVIAESILKKGTHESSFRIQVMATGRKDPVIVSIPVKIVKY